MELKSLKAFKDKEAEIDNSKLGVYRGKLQEQLKYYQEQLQRAMVLELTTDIMAAKSRIAILQDKLSKPIRIHGQEVPGIDESCLIPLAEKVWNESQSYQEQYQKEITDAWQTALQAREDYLNAVKKIGQLRNEGFTIVSQANCCALTLRRNPLEKIRVGRLDPFVVDYNVIDKLTR